jgi:hypothetical protein
MKQVLKTLWLGCAAPIIILLAAGELEAAVSSGVRLDLYVDEQSHPDLRFALGVDAIRVSVVIKNDTPWPLNTDRGFSQVDLFKALILTDPNGKKHTYSKEAGKVFDVLPSISWNQTPTSKAEVLPAGWVRSVLIEDLRSLFAIINTTPGWYVIEAQQPFVRFAWTVEAGKFGLLGPQQDANNWHGTIDSNKIQIYVAPASGAQLQARVWDGSAAPAQPIAQVPVRVFEASAIPTGNLPQQTWDKVNYILEGTTDSAGWAVWESESETQCLPETAYVVMAHYLDKYEQNTIATGTGAGWESGCEGAIVEELVFGQQPPQVISGDLDGNQCVDRSDYSILMADVRDGQPNNPAHDLNGDGAVNIADARYLVTLFTNPRGAPCQ